MYRVRQKEVPDLGGAYFRVGNAYIGGERGVEQRCTGRVQCTPWRGRQNIEPAFIVEAIIKNGGSRDDIGWSPRSPDLTTCDFFFWGNLKPKVYEQRPLTLEALKEAI
jgi:hypothetical protein